MDERSQTPSESEHLPSSALHPGASSGGQLGESRELGDRRCLLSWLERLGGERAAGRLGEQAAPSSEAEEVPTRSEAPEKTAADAGSRADADPKVESAGSSSNDTLEQQSDLPADTLLLSISRRAMACEFEVLLNQHQYPSGAEHAVAALDLIQQLERLLSVYKPRSELSTLNRFGESCQVAISHDTRVMLELAIDLHRLTGGAFDITAGKLSEVWGFSRQAGQMPDEATITSALATVGSHYLQIDAERGTAGCTQSGMQVNPGGIGKGYALDRAVGSLEREGLEDFMLHGGLSSAVARGDRRHRQTGGGWLVSLKHPWRWEEPLGTIRLRNQALGTSGSGKQFFHYGGQRFSHIIDPRSGWPAQGMMSVTVICPSCAVADALATGLFVMGYDGAVEFCRRHPAIGAIMVFSELPSNRLQIATCNLDEQTWTPRQVEA